MKRSEKILVAVLLVFACSAIYFAAFLSSYSLPVQDLAQYWAAAHFFAKNPYSMELTKQFEQAAGITSPPLITKMPPWSLTLVLPLGVLGYHVSFAVWSLMSILVIAGCAFAIGRRFYSRSSLEPAVLPFIFGPTLVLLMLGQFTVLLLLGATLFCLFVRKGRDWLAGASLLLVVSKPHTTLLFLIAIALWIVFAKRWVVLISGLLAFTTSSIAAVAINPHIFEQFRERSLLVVHETESYPNLGGMLYSVSGMHAVALVPQIAGIVWIFFYWRKQRFGWNWEREGMFVLLVSVTCSYYSYPYDEILALPALITALAVGNRKAFAIPFVITECAYAAYISNFAGRFGYGYMFLWWTALGWLASVLLAKTTLFERGQKEKSTDLQKPA